MFASKLIVSAMFTKMFVVRDRIEQTQNVLARFGIELIRKDRISGSDVCRQLQFRIIHDDFAVVPDSKRGADLQRNPDCLLIDFHCPSRLRTWLACSFDANRETVFGTLSQCSYRYTKSIPAPVVPKSSA